MKHIAQAVSTLRKRRGKKRKKEKNTNPVTITISIQTIAGSQLGINCPDQHSHLKREAEGREKECLPI